MRSPRPIEPSLGRAGLLLLLAGCLSPTAGTAVASTAVAVTAAAGSLATGRCLAACSPGYACNEHTGLCDALPCGGPCAAGETCVSTAHGDRCSAQVDLQITSTPAGSNR